jgi:hypothetical protein
MKAALYKGPFSLNPRKFTKFLINDAVHNIIAVHTKGNDRPPRLPLAYQSLLDPAFIFVWPLPAQRDALTAFQKFALLHEIGHLSKLAADDLYREVTKRMWTWTVFWIALFADWNATSAAALLLMFLIQLVMRLEWDLWPQRFSNQVLNAEMEADRLALGGPWTRDELEELHRDLSTLPIADGRLATKTSDRGEAYRYAMLLNEIETMLVDGRRSKRSYRRDPAEQTAWTSLATVIGLTAVGQSHSTWKIWVAISITVILVWSGVTCIRWAYRRLYEVSHLIRQRMAVTPSL